MLGKRYPSLQRIGQFVRDKTIRLQQIKWYIDKTSQIFPKYTNTIASWTWIFSCRILWNWISTVCTSKFFKSRFISIFFSYKTNFIFQNKQFVYRGLEYERIGTFTQRLQTEFPQAQILTKNSPPDKSILSAPEQYIQISNVRPIGDPKALKSAMVPVPEKIARFYEVREQIWFFLVIARFRSILILKICWVHEKLTVKLNGNVFKNM